MRERPADPRVVIRRLNWLGFSVLALLVGGVGGWAAMAEISGAVIAPGTVVVESNVKKVQHPTGGIVGEILVQDGSVVEAGQVVMRLDDTVTRATLGIVRTQLDELLAKEARLIAERDGADAVAFPEELRRRAGGGSAAGAIAGEQKLFESRRQANDGKRAQLRERVTQANEEIRGLSAQQRAKEVEIKFIGEELAGVTDLYKRNLVTIVRFNQLQRDQAKLEGERGQFVAEIARAKGRISELELQIIQLDQDFRTEVLRDLRDAQARIGELRERVTAAEDQLRRIDLRAPIAGFVHQLSVHTVGGVIANGETVMVIVPRTNDLVVEAKVAPQDIDQIARNAAANVRIAAGNQRTTPELKGVVTMIGADLVQDPKQNVSYYPLRVALSAEEIRRLHDFELVPGMPAEVFVQTHDRTPLQYLLKPLNEQVARVFRER
jgi:HlyD family secretion protein